MNHGESVVFEALNDGGRYYPIFIPNVYGQPVDIIAFDHRGHGIFVEVKEIRSKTQRFNCLRIEENQKIALDKALRYGCSAFIAFVDRQDDISFIPWAKLQDIVDTRPTLAYNDIRKLRIKEDSYDQSIIDR